MVIFLLKNILKIIELLKTIDEQNSRKFKLSELKKSIENTLTIIQSIKQLQNHKTEPKQLMEKLKAYNEQIVKLKDEIEKNKKQFENAEKKIANIIGLHRELHDEEAYIDKCKLELKF